MTHAKLTRTHLRALETFGWVITLVLVACSESAPKRLAEYPPSEPATERYRGVDEGVADGDANSVVTHTDAGAGAAQGGPAVAARAPASCSSSVSGTGAPLSGDVVVGWTDEHQTMVGFGASDKYHPLLTNQQADLLFSPTAGIGLSMLRVAISPSGAYIGTPANAKLAAARGALVWAVPWSPPGEWKDNGRTTNGGHLLAAHYTDWAMRLASFTEALLQSTGVRLYALSPQNEANYAAAWDSCIYTPAELTSFVKVLGPLVAKKSPHPLLVAPEAASWGPLWDYTRAMLADPTASSYVDVFSVHQYSGVTAPQTPVRPIWETEYSTFDPATAGIDNGLNVAQQISHAIIVGNASAWHYWWLITRGSDNEGLLAHDGSTTKRLYTVGNFSKFVRPGNVRIGTSADPTGVETTAFKNGCSNAFAVVVINTHSSDAPFGLAFNGATVDTVTPWVTSANTDLAAGKPISAAGGRFATTLRARSVTTFVGTAH